MGDDIEILHNKRNKKFYTIIDGEECLLQYEEDKNILDFFHTYVHPKLRGRGIASKILHFAANYARKNKKKIIPSCSYAYSFFIRHKEYKDLLI